VPPTRGTKRSEALEVPPGCRPVGRGSLPSHRQERRARVVPARHPERRRPGVGLSQRRGRRGGTCSAICGSTRRGCVPALNRTPCGRANRCLVWEVLELGQTWCHQASSSASRCFPSTRNLGQAVTVGRVQGSLGCFPPASGQPPRHRPFAPSQERSRGEQVALTQAMSSGHEVVTNWRRARDGLSRKASPG
jgi:hypothetical protein